MARCTGPNELPPPLPIALTTHMPRLRHHLATAAFVAGTCALFLGAWGCSEPNTDGEQPTVNERPIVVCTTSMIGDILREVAGDAATVHVLFGATVDDVASLMAADLVLYNGFGLEGYLGPTLERVAKSGTDLVAIAESILVEGEPMQDAGVSDPHVWMDPHLWARTAPLIANALVKELSPGDPAIAAIQQRAAATHSRLLDLDARAAAALKTIPETTRTLVTAHDAFRYFGRRYGLRVEGIQGLSTASEGGLQAIETLVSLLVDSKIPAVFFESTVSERNVKALIEGAGARGHIVALGGTLHSDAPGSAGTYEAMMKHNIQTIASALGGRTDSMSDAALPGEALK